MVATKLKTKLWCSSSAPVMIGPVAFYRSPLWSINQRTRTPSSRFRLIVSSTMSLEGEKNNLILMAPHFSFLDVDVIVCTHPKPKRGHHPWWILFCLSWVGRVLKSTSNLLKMEFICPTVSRPTAVARPDWWIDNTSLGYLWWWWYPIVYARRLVSLFAILLCFCVM